MKMSFLKIRSLKKIPRGRFTLNRFSLKRFSLIIAFFFPLLLFPQLTLARQWNYTLEFQNGPPKDTLAWEGDVGSRFLTPPRDIETLGTLCSRIRIKNPAANVATVRIEWGSQAHTLRVDGPGHPRDVRCIIRAETNQSCVLTQSKQERSSRCHLQTRDLVLSAVAARSLGPGWALDGPLNSVRMPFIEGTLTLLP